jgi:hypothetical protein
MQSKPLFVNGLLLPAATAHPRAAARFHDFNTVM